MATQIQGPPVTLPDAVQFCSVTSPAEIYFDQSYDRTNKERAEKGEKRLKLRDFMDSAKQAWADLAEDDQMPFVERYKELCRAEDKEDQIKEPVVKEKKEKKRKAPAEKENSDSSGDKDGDAAEEQNTAEEASEGEEENAEESKPQKAKKPKAAKKPELTEEEKKKKKPLGAYFIYTGEKRTELVKEQPDLKVTEVAKELGAKWKAMSEEEKAPYHEKANELKRKWVEDNPEMVAESEAKKAKKAKKEKKELTPEELKKKKPPSAYFIFGGETRPVLMQEQPELKMTEVAKELGARWGAMTEEEKAPYIEQQNVLKRKWNLDNDKEEFDGIKEKKAAGEEGAEEGEKKQKKQKEAAPKKPPTDVIQLFINTEFRKGHKESNPDAKPKEIREAGETAWEEVSEEDKAEWQAKYDALVEAYPQQEQRPIKPTKAKVPGWKDLYSEDVLQKFRALEKNADVSEEEAQKHAQLKVKGMSKAEKMMWQETAKKKKDKAEKEYDAAITQWEADAAEFEAAQKAKSAEEVEDAAEPAESTEA